MTAEEALRGQVRAALDHAGISQAEAARQLGLSHKHVNQMITGRAAISLARAEQLLGLCGMRIAIAITLDPNGRPVIGTNPTEPGTCTATVTDYDGTVHHCEQPAGHYDPTRTPDFTPGAEIDPGGYHHGDGHTWTDDADHATPHQPTPKDPA